MRKMKSLSGFWAITMLILFGCLMVYALYYQSKSDYLNLENKIVEVIKNDQKLAKIGSDKFITRIDSESFKHLISLNNKEDKCVGYVNVYNFKLFKIRKSFISCNSFKSIGYEK